MKKELKQNSLLSRLKYHKINLSVWYVLVKLYNEEPVKEELLKKVNPSLAVDGKLTQKGIDVLKSIDDLFATKKKLKSEQLMGDDYQNKIEEYLDLFPIKKLPNGKYARGDKRNVEVNFRWFFENYNYSWEVILESTNMYVKEYAQKNFLYMRTAKYFVRKDDGTRNVNSDLADYCDRYVDHGCYVEEKTFKTKVI